MLEEYSKSTLVEFNGQYVRGAPENVPPDHFVDSRNLDLSRKGFGIRPGSSLLIDFLQQVNDIAQWISISGVPPYPVVGITLTGAILMYKDGVVTQIYQVSGATNFYTINYFGRLFIEPTNPNGPVGNMLMLYINPSGQTIIREAGGDAPNSATPMTAVVNSSGGQTVTSPVISPSSATQNGNQNVWSDPLNVLTLNQQYAKTTLFGNAGANFSNELDVFFNTGSISPLANIPDNAIVLGIQVTIAHKQFSGTSAVEDAIITLLGVGANNKNNPAAWNNSIEETFTYGGPSDTWGNPNISGADVKSPSFGVAISIDCTLAPGNGAVAGVDYVTMQITWKTSSGNIAAGTYMIDVLYNTDTGFLTPPSSSPNLKIQVVVGSDNSSITLSNIPTGPSYVTSREIIVALVDINGNVSDYFFVPTEDGGIINDNTTTTATISFFVTDLVENANYLFNVRPRIPAGQGINLYAARLVLWGFPQPDASTLRLSNRGDPETFDLTQESLIVVKDDGYICTNTAILNDLLYIWKNKGIYSTFDNDDIPVNWDTTVVDQSVGCGFRGLSTASPTLAKGSHSGLIAFADDNGAYLFNGNVQQPEISWKVEDLWNIDVSQVSTIIDIVYKRIFFYNFPAGTTLAGLCLVASFSDGASADAIKWDTWTYLNNIRLLIDDTGKFTLVVNILSSGKIIKLDTTQFHDYVDGSSTSPINHYAILGGQEAAEGAINILEGIRIRVTGDNALYTTVSGEDDIFTATPINRVSVPLGGPLVIQNMPSRTVVKGEEDLHPHFMSERAYIKFEAQPIGSTKPIDVDAHFSITRIILYQSPIYAERPQ